MLENQSGCHIKVLRTDRGGEFISKEFNFFLWRRGHPKGINSSLHSITEWNRWTKKSNYCGDGKKYVTSKETSKPILGQSRSNICLSIKHLTNKGGYESNSLWSMAWKETICKSFMNLWLCCLCFETSSNSSEAWWKIWKNAYIGYCTQSKAYKLYNPLVKRF